MLVPFSRQFLAGERSVYRLLDMRIHRVGGAREHDYQSGLWTTRMFNYNENHWIRRMDD